MSRRASLVAVIMCLSGTALCANGAVFTLADGNATAVVDAAGAGMCDWTVDGVDQLGRQWFWLRLADIGPESNVSTLPYIGGLTDTNFDGFAETLYLCYTSPQVMIELTFILRGGAAGSGTSDIIESIAISNISSSPLTTHFFQYVDLNLNNSVINKSLVITGGNTATQAMDSCRVAETVVTPRPSHYQAGTAPLTQAALEDALPTTLSDTTGPTGPDDLAWAFQWDALIAAGGKLIISKDKQVIPEPCTMILLTVGAVATLLRKRR
ncbi:MAG: PEP-CTERM sorting domain-containing protein [Planctomycetaceae bacterium]|nr:PEP-CTERM sorting domain-containing protein [Planctomycetaceae bacterium]